MVQVEEINLLDIDDAIYPYLNIIDNTINDIGIVIDTNNQINNGNIQQNTTKVSNNEFLYIVLVLYSLISNNPELSRSLKTIVNKENLSLSDIHQKISSSDISNDPTKRNGNIHCVNIKSYYNNGQIKNEYSLYDAKYNIDK